MKKSVKALPILLKENPKKEQHSFPSANISKKKSCRKLFYSCLFTYYLYPFHYTFPMTEMLSVALPQCISESLYESFASAEIKQPQILFFNMHIITSKLVTNNLHTQYINMKFKSRCFCLSFIGKVLSPSTCLTNINQDLFYLSLLIHVFLSRRNEPSGSGTVESIVYAV